MGTYSFYSDLRGLQFTEGGNSAWMQAMPIGKYKHPVYGEINFTEERVARFADNVNKGVVGTELDIDYDHKAFTGKAAGWIKQAENRGPDGLYIRVDFTPEAASAIKAGEYRYFSPEFQDKWTHPKTNVEHEDVLRGGGLTNRPFLKDILPVNLSELTFEMPKNKEEGVTPKELREALGLAETATDDEVRAKLTELVKPKDPPKNDPPAPNPIDELAKQFGEHPAFKALTEQMAAQQLAITTMQADIKKANVAARLSDVDKGKVVLAPAAKEAFGKILLGENVADAAEAFLKSLQDGSAIVELGERGANDPNKGQTDAEKLFDTEIAKLMSEQKLSYADAATELARVNPQLFAQYREASTAFKA